MAENIDPFDDAEPGSKGGGGFPHVCQLTGRLLILKPTNLTKNAPGVEEGKVSDRMDVDVHVLSGDPIGEIKDGYGAVKTTLDTALEVPFLCEGMWINQKVLVNQLRDAYRKEGIVLGVLVVDEPRKKGQRGAYSLESANDKQKEYARKYWTEHLAAAKKKDPWD